MDGTKSMIKINYYAEYWKSSDDVRNLEVINCINKNIKSNLFNNIFIFSETAEDRIESPVHISSRITYQNIFDMNNDGINVLANADIEFDDTLKLAINIKNNEFYAITRYENNGLLHKYDDPYRGSDSQDVWIWKDPCKIKNANFNLGLPGCDNKIAYYAQQHNYILKNPALSIKTIHRHVTHSRPGSSSNLSKRLMPPYTLIEVSTI